MSQIVLPLSRAASGPARIVLGVGNASVGEALARPESWPFRTAVLTGPPRSGKSLLARWFAERQNGDAIDDALAATKCITSEQNQVEYAVETGNMPARTEAYDSADLAKAYPTDLLQAFRDSIKAAAPRPVTPYWSDISSAIQSTWHSPTSVNQSTPEKSEQFISDVLKGRKLL